MSERSAIAYASPCFEAEECAHPRFKRLVWIKPRLEISSILTANIGLE